MRIHEQIDFFSYLVSQTKVGYTFIFIGYTFIFIGIQMESWTLGLFS